MLNFLILFFMANKTSKQYTDTQMYHSSIAFLKKLNHVAKNQSREFRSWYFEQLMRDCNDMVLNWSLSYVETDRRNKFNFAKKNIELLKKISIQIQLLHDINLINFNQIRSLSFDIGKISSQAHGWFERMKSQLEQPVKETI